MGGLTEERRQQPELQTEPGQRDRTGTGRGRREAVNTHLVTACELTRACARTHTHTYTHMHTHGDIKRIAGLGVWDSQMQITMYRMDEQQAPTAEHREVYSIFCDKP